MPAHIELTQSPQAQSIKEPAKRVQSCAWSQEAFALKLSGMAKQVVLNSLKSEVDGKIKLLVSRSVQPMMNEKVKQDIEEALTAFYKRKASLSLDFADQLTAETPIEYQQRMDDEDRAQFIQNLNNGDFGISMKQNFNAVLLEHSVKRIVIT